MAFTHLQVRSGYSFYQSTMTIETLVKQAKALQFHTIALTDEAVLHGAVSFYQTCMTHGIKPILGMVADVKVAENDPAYSVVLLAKTNKGYQHLMAISTEIQLNGNCSLTLLKEHSDDVICIVSSASPAIKEFLKKHQYDRLVSEITPLADVFSGDNVYIGLEVYTETDFYTLIENVRALQEVSDISLVAHHDARYVQQKDIVSYDCLQAMKNGKKWTPDELKKDMEHHHLRSVDEMERLFQEVPELLETNQQIAASCSVSFDFEQQLLPAFPVPTSETASEYLAKTCHQALPYKYEQHREAATERLKKELNVIDELGFSDYFLIVADFVQFAKDQGIVVGPGRGSAAGSIVAYVLGITNVNPLKYDLLFERFLNPERITMPDIDIDFSDVRRDEVITYIREKYGSDHVAQIITFGTFAARSLIRELMKTMEIDYRDQNYILQHIPVQANKPVSFYIKESDEFSAYIKQSNQLKMLFTIAIKLEGLPRHMSTHAAGIVIGKKDLIEDVPLTKGTNDTYLTQYAMNELEAIGLLKMDILGLRNLTLMERIVQSVERSQQTTIDVDTFPEHDEKTFQLLQAGKTNGIFQLESSGMKNVLTALKPTSLEDIIALNALYRPGPMEQIPTYVKRKHQQEKVTYLHPALQPILENTYGVLVYQEQIMQVAHQFAGLSLGEADILRRAIGKKNHQLIQEQKETFIQGCLQKGYEPQIAEEVFSWIYKFANYGFNKSHSVAYSKIAYQLSYLKAHYPTNFFAHLLGTAINDSAKLHLYIREANEYGIQILPPSINKSFAYFTEEKGNIRIGLMAIKGIGYETVNQIMKTRTGKAYQDLFDFCIRVKHIKRNVLETLILAGTFDETYRNRASLLASIDQAVDRAELFGDENGQGDLFSDELRMRPAYTEMEDFSKMQKLSDEKELLQMYISNHPLKEFRRSLSVQQYTSVQQAQSIQPNTKIKMVAIIQSIKKIHTKRGDSMAFMMVSDETGEMDVVLFPSVFREVGRKIEEEMTVSIFGKVTERQGKKQMAVDSLSLFDIEALQEQSTGYMYIKLTKDMDEKQALQQLQKLVGQHKGETQVLLYREADKQMYKLENKYNLAHDESTMLELKEFFGSENVVFSR